MADQGTTEATEAKTDAKPTERHLSRADAKCSVEGCKRPYRAKTYCVTHYKLWRRGEIATHKSRYKICSKEACKKPMVQWGMCEEHVKAAKSGEVAA